MSRIIRMSVRKVYHKFADIELDLPEDVEMENARDWAANNTELWETQLDEKLEAQEVEPGFGLEWHGMSESDNECESRFDVVVDKKIVYGGHC